MPTAFTVADVTRYIRIRIKTATSIFTAIMVTIPIVTVLALYPSYI